MMIAVDAASGLSDPSGSVRAWLRAMVRSAHPPFTEAHLYMQSHCLTNRHGVSETFKARLDKFWQHQHDYFVRLRSPSEFAETGKKLLQA